MSRLPTPSEGVARLFLALHVALIAFATVAMATILAGGFPTLMESRFAPRVFEIAWRYTGPTYVLLGFAAVLAHAGPRLGWRRAAAALGLAAGLTLAVELVGTNTGLPFGPYHYTEMLGYRVAGDVPLVIPLSWSYMLYASLVLAARLLPGTPQARPWMWAAIVGLLLVAWDIPLEAQMTSVSPPHWVWDLDGMPAWVPAWLGRGWFYGMPLTNWMGWFVTGTLIARLALALLPDPAWAALRASALPLLVYAANGVMPIATTARHGLWGASLAGLLAMGLPLALALWRVPRVPQPRAL